MGLKIKLPFVASPEKNNSQVKECLSSQIKYRMGQYDHLLLISQKDLRLLMGTFRQISPHEDFKDFKDRTCPVKNLKSIDYSNFNRFPRSKGLILKRFLSVTLV